MPYRGSWHPTRGTWVPTLLAVQILVLGQALLRGADYFLLPRNIIPLELMALIPPPLWMWGAFFGAFAIVGLVGIVGHWGYTVAVGHCGVAVAYLCVTVALLDAGEIGSPWRVAFGALLFAFGAALVRVRPPDPRRFAALRALVVALLLLGCLGVINGLGHDFRTATGLACAACVHAVIGVAILRTVQRQKIRARITDDP